MEARPLVVECPDGPMPGLLLEAASPSALLVLAHGAGAGMRHPFMHALAQALAAAGVSSLRYQFPFMERGGRPDAPAVAAATVRAAVEAAGRLGLGLPLYAGGKSFGGRMTSTAAAEAALPDVRGLVFFGFPLHLAKRPAIKRADHLDQVTVPMLFLQGTRDLLAEPDLMRQVCRRLRDRVTLHEIDGADHAFAVLKRSGRTGGEVLDELAATAAGWMTGG